MLGGGETDTIVFEVPAPGTYKFICSFPAHYMKMQGDFVVR
jgi:azurin